ncbi:putative tRNA-splicing endonuclease subunit Sen2 [Xylariales sp. AK1849]|nr:putative tRNA-splicing endonuclease subunit Sen2 [Xylariales sp. AK1849]
MAATRIPSSISPQHEMTQSPPAASNAEGAVSGMGHEAPTQVVPEAPKGPPLWKIHELPTPIRTFPLPSFYPNNPVSLFHIAYTWIAQVVSPPPQEPSAIHRGIWIPKTRSVHVTDPKSIRALWEQGFYGKGHLSRSEPNWFKREQARSGAHSGHVAEVFTAKRREERQQMKWERAKLEQEAIQRTRFDEAWIAPVGPKELLALPNSQRDLEALIFSRLPDGLSPEPSFNRAAHAAIQLVTTDHTTAPEDDSISFFPMLNGQPPRPSTPPHKLPTPPASPPKDNKTPLKRRKSVRFSPKVESTTFLHSDPPSPSCVSANGNGKMPDSILMNNTTTLSREPSLLSIEETIVTHVGQEAPPVAEPELKGKIVDKEHLQLTLEEAFWLTFGLGVLAVEDQITGVPLPVETLFTLFRHQSYFPPRVTDLQPDDPFMIHYVVYHHFRSLGWVTRPGIKFGCDWLLYHRGPAFSHAEFAIIVLPAYSDPYWKEQGRAAPHNSWHWLHLVNRVQSTALKTLVLVYVDIPAPVDRDLDISSTLQRYKIREVMVKRWLINRNRD